MPVLFRAVISWVLLLLQIKGLLLKSRFLFPQSLGSNEILYLLFVQLNIIIISHFNEIGVFLNLQLQFLVGLVLLTSEWPALVSVVVALVVVILRGFDVVVSLLVASKLAK